VRTVRYEDLVERPEEEVPAICDFLALPYMPAMLAIEETDRSKVVEDQAGWFTNVWSGINTTGVGKWRREMSTEDEALFESVAGADLAALGYETHGNGAGAGMRAPAYAAHDAAMRTVNFVRLRLVQERGREVRHVLRRKLAR
jgi:Sulfotransferase domain